MANANPSFPGADNLVTTTEADKRVLFEEIFTGEVWTAYKEKNVMRQYHRVRTIEHGKSADFAAIGKAVGRRHTPGTEILGQEIAHGEQTISIDDLLIADVFMSKLHEKMASYDTRAPYANELGDALARIYDKTVLRVAISAARATNPITTLPGGSTVTLPAGYAADTDANKAIMLADAIFASHQIFMEKRSAMASEVKCFITPADYFRLVRNKDLLNTDWGGLGSYGRAELPMVGGVELVVTNHLPQQDDTAVVSGGNFNDGIDSINSKYAIDASKVQAVLFAPDACGTVELIDFSVDDQWDLRRMGHLVVASQAVGHGVLRPECAVEIVVP